MLHGTHSVRKTKKQSDIRSTLSKKPPPVSDRDHFAVHQEWSLMRDVTVITPLLKCRADFIALAVLLEIFLLYF